MLSALPQRARRQVRRADRRGASRPLASRLPPRGPGQHCGGAAISRGARERAHARGCAEARVPAGPVRGETGRGGHA
eukprot:4171320-Pleurochrysis_carterae.AAC.1